MKSYLLAPGDTIRLVVEGLPDYSFTEVLIRPDGQINLPIYGTVQASGKTVPQLQAILRQRLGRRYRHPERLTVTLIRPRPVQPSFIAVNGNGVRVSSRVDVGDDGMRLTGVIAAVGGVQGRIEEVQAFVARPGKPQIAVDIYQAVTNPSSKANIRLMKDDVLTINQVDPQPVTLQGDVNRPGVYLMRRIPNQGAASYDIQLNSLLLDLLVAGDGLKLPDADQPHTAFNGFILRGDKKISLHIPDAANYEESAVAKEPLKPGDLVNITAVREIKVPSIDVFVDGLVEKSGNIELEQGDGVVEALAKAGSLTEPVDQVQVTVRRKDQVIPVDLYQAVVENSPKANIPLENKDFIQVRETKRINIEVTGKVNKPLQVRVTPDTSLLSALTQAGNPSVAKMENARINILRTLPNGRLTKLSVDPVGLYSHDLSQNTRLQDGDVISVTEVFPEEVVKEKQTVYVTGQVAKRGDYDLQEGEGLTEVLVRAGGPTDKALLNQVQVQRGGETHTVAMYSALKNGVEPVKFPLQRGDIIVVPENTNRVVVMDAVNTPGDVLLPEEGTLTVFDAINKAGGFKPNAKTTEIAILRPVNGGLKQINVAIVKGVPSTNEPLQPNDVVYVPQGKVPQGLSSKMGPLLGLMGIVNAFK